MHRILSRNSLHSVYQMSIPQEHLFTMQYYPTDFFYSTNSQDMPQGFEGCTILGEENKNIICNKITTDSATVSSTDVTKCYQSALCENQRLVNKLYQIRNDHYMSQEQYDNIKHKYDFEVVKTVNLIIGIAAAAMFIHFSKQSVLNV
jgi:hypothetical protein